MKHAILLLMIFSSALSADSPKDALEAFKKAAKSKDEATTWSLSTQFDDAHVEVNKHLKGNVKSIIKYFEEGSDFDLLDFKIDGDCAVVVINASLDKGKKSYDIDPAYLLKQNGKWKVFPDICDWSMTKYAAKDKVKTYEKLQAWFKNRKAEIHKKKKANKALHPTADRP